MAKQSDKHEIGAIEARADALARAVRVQAAAAAAQDEGTSGYVSGVLDVIEAAEQLLECEERIPEVRARAAARPHVKAVRLAGVGLVAVALVLGLAAVLGWLSTAWWLLLIVPTGVLGGFGASVVSGPGKVNSVGVSVAFGVSGLSLLLIATHAVPYLFIGYVVTLVAACAGAVASLPETSVGAGQ